MQLSKVLVMASFSRLRRDTWSVDGRVTLSLISMDEHGMSWMLIKESMPLEGSADIATIR